MPKNTSVCLGGLPTLLLCIMESQVAAVRHKIRNLEDRIHKAEQNLAAAEQGDNREKEKLQFDLLLSLNNQLNGLQEEKNIILRRPAPSKLPYFQM